MLTFSGGRKAALSFGGISHSDKWSGFSVPTLSNLFYQKHQRIYIQRLRILLLCVLSHQEGENFYLVLWKDLQLLKQLKDKDKLFKIIYGTKSTQWLGIKYLNLSYYVKRTKK